MDDSRSWGALADVPPPTRLRPANPLRNSRSPPCAPHRDTRLVVRPAVHQSATLAGGCARQKTLTLGKVPRLIS